MDEEADFANILSQSTISKPTWSTNTTSDPSSDPWANPFSSSSPTNPFASSTSAFGSTSAYVPSLPQLDPEDEVSPYVAKLEEDDRFGIGNLPDPPSVIAAREQEATDADEGFGSYPNNHEQEFTVPYSPPKSQEAAAGASVSPVPASRKLPSDLIDDDLMAESDPSVTLKKAFVKSSSTPRAETKGEGKKAYVFTPSKPVKKETDGKDKGKTPEKKSTAGRQDLPIGTTQPVKESESVTDAAPAESEILEKEGPQESLASAAVLETNGSTEESVKEEAAADKPSVSMNAELENATTSPDGPESTQPQISEAVQPESIPLPASGQATPSISRIASPVSASKPGNSGFLSANDLFSPNSTPKHDRVAVSPLDPPPPAEKDYGFHNLSIGGSSQSTSAPPSKPDWTQPQTSAVSTGSGSRFAGKGWAAVDETDDLFGAVGPSVRSDPWGGNGEEGEGWTGDNVPTLSGPSHSNHSTSSSPAESSRPLPTELQADEPPPTPSKRKSPLFQISVGDPTKVGDPVRGYTVYTVRTRTQSPHYRKSEISVLRRFSEFLWLFDALTLNNPGVIVPPMPDKQPWGRFQDTFVETRRQALQRCLTKITSHPILQLDPDLRLFLESDSFSVEAKNRRLEIVPEKTGLLANWTGPRYFEQDDWFDSRKSFLEGLESQLKGLSKSIESASKSRLELSVTMGDYAASMTDLAESDLGSGMCAALARLSDLARQEKEVHEEQAKGDVMTLLNMADEYVRFIGSVRLAFAARIRAFHHWQNMEKEVGRMKSTREKLRQQGKLGDRVNSSLGEINDAERRVRDSSVDFENISKLIKSEFIRFERERVEEFKRILENQLDLQIEKQKELIDAWEGYHGFVLKMVQKSQGR